MGFAQFSYGIFMMTIYFDFLKYIFTFYKLYDGNIYNTEVS